MNTNIAEMMETARQIENMAFLLRSTAESGQLYSAGEDVVEDIATVIQEKARELRQRAEVISGETDS